MLVGPAAPAPERLLAERVVASWLQVDHAYAMAAQAADSSLRLATFALKRHNSSTLRRSGPWRR